MSKYTSAGPRQLQAAQGSAEANGLGPDESPPAYSYIRFSHPDQAAGDSLRRQTEKAEAYCRRRGWALDRTLTLRDLGVSAYRGKNALVGNLRTFLEAIDRGTVRPGSALIVESIDRISRQGIDEGYDLCKRILKAGIRLVTLTPEREFGPEAVRSLTKGALEIQLILERAAEESATKSERVREARAEGRRQARDAGRIFTRRCPAWLTIKDGRFEVIPEAAKAVRLIFSLRQEGLGLRAIERRLNVESTWKPPPRKAQKTTGWRKSYLKKIRKSSPFTT